MAKHSFNTLMKRLSRAGFKRQFVSTALVPDWWDESCAQDPQVLPEVEVMVARFLDTPMSVVRNADAPLMPPLYDGARLRRVRGLDINRLGPAIHTAIQVSQAVVRNLRCNRLAEAVPTDALAWRRIVNSGVNRPVLFEDILSNLWAKGIPVIPLDSVPTPNFQGLASVVEGRPVIVLGQRYDEPGRIAFLVAHEAGHIAAGDCSLNSPVLDENEQVQDDSDMERNADLFATRVLVGKDLVDIPDEEGLNAKELAQLALKMESETCVDASSTIYAWAAKTLDYATATMAVKALYRSLGARRQLRKAFDEHVDLDSAGESDRSLLRCVYGEHQPTAVVD